MTAKRRPFSANPVERSTEFSTEALVHPSAEARQHRPPMVGIGASAGGLEAATRMLSEIPPDTGLAYLLVQHLDPVHESTLVPLLDRVAKIPVVQAADGMRVQADHVYVIPPNATMTVTDGHLRLVTRDLERGPHFSIDTFLCSLADVEGNAAVGVILSGTGTDGSQGIRAIKEAGGITMAQDAASARFSGMPESAIATGCIDFVLTPEELATQLVLLGKQIAQHGWNTVITAAEGEEEELRRIFMLLKNRTGVDFQRYRRGTMHRRILRRMLVHRQDTRTEYLAFLRRNPSELDVLYEDLLIGVTNFFRDPEVFDTLQTTIFPQLMRDRPPDAPIRMWTAGCSGGEETYSLAIVLLEFLGERAADTLIQIFGTDVNESAVASARSGVYPESIAEHVSAERLQRFFVAEAGRYRIAKAVRDLCIFSRQNIVRDPPFSHLDLISCRNVLIYLEPSLQQRVFPVFHYALEPYGVLLLGTAESVRSAAELFAPADKRNKIFRPQPSASQRLDIDHGTSGDAYGAGKHGTRQSVSAVGPRMTKPAVDELEAEANRLLLNRFAPACVIVNEHLDVLHFIGDTAAFLSHAAGAASLELPKLVPPELVMPLRVAVRAATVERRAVREDYILLADATSSASAAGGHATSGNARALTIQVLPLDLPSTAARFFVVTFAEDHGATPKAAAPATADGSADHAADSPEPSTRHRRRSDERESERLRNELATMTRYVQAITEEHEATNEELRAANEEIQSSNEELQSTNEELETTKEEIQSTNEELITVNDELRRRNEELQSLAGDLTNVLTSTTIPVIIVDSDLCVRRFTPASNRIMRVVATDVGRPLGDIKLLLPLPDIESQITQTMHTLEISRQELVDDEGHWWELTIRPYLTVDRRVDGAILVFGDIDATKRYGLRAEHESRVQQELAKLAEDARAEAVVGRETADEANRAKGRFLASMSHDLRTPLNAIAGYTDLIAAGIRGPVTPDQVHDLERISRSSRHLLALINDILNFAKAESGHVDFKMTNFAIASVTSEMEELIGGQLAGRSITFEGPNCSPDDDSPLIVYADPEKVRQVILNLLTNAMKFTAAGGRIGIDCAVPTAGDTGVVQVVVWDTGEGIAPEQTARIFEPFVQVNRGLTTPPPDGVGLGLAISRDLARAMGGDLTVESVVNRGSRFTLTLPAGTTAEPPLPDD
jgi:two-component system CheB/CheR fusion protein